MKLKDVDLTKMLPSFMKNDKFDVLLAEGLSNVFKKMGDGCEKVVIIGQIDRLNEDELDQLAEDMNIFWYSVNADIEIKRQLIKDANLVFSTLGTVWAVEMVINQYLPNTELQEWFDYDGDPHYFRLTTNDTSILSSDIASFLDILEKVKRKSQWLEDIILQLRARGQLYPGFAVLEKSTDTITFKTSA